MNMPGIVFYASMLVVSAHSAQLYAEETTDRNILSIGCQKDKGICTLQLNGDAVGGRGCLSNMLMFNAATDKNADAILSLLSAAFFAGKKVRFEISGRCSDQEGTATFDSFRVLN